jgi:hypothetical protein
MISDNILENYYVRVEGSKIIEIDDMDSLSTPETAIVIDCKNMYLLPGLADMHVHYLEEYKVPFFNLFLANGVTTIRSLAGNKHQLTLKEKINNKEIDGPNFYLSGPILNGGNYDGDINIGIDDPEEIRKELITEHKLGYDFVKFYSWIKKEVFEEAIKTAKELNMKTVGHIPYSVGLDGIIECGMDEIAHIEELLCEFLIGFDNTVARPNVFGLEIDNSKLDFVMKKIKEAGIKLGTTLTLDKVIVEKISNPKEFLEKSSSKYLSEKVRNLILNNSDDHQVLFEKGKEMLDWFVLYQKILQKAKELQIPLVLGTDAGARGNYQEYACVPGFSIHEELNILVENGFTPFAAISQATRLASENLEMGEEWGTLEIGKRADMLLVKKNPLLDIKHLRSIIGVMVSGKWYSESKLHNLIKL